MHPEMRVNKVMRRNGYEDMGRCRKTILKLFRKKIFSEEVKGIQLA